MNRIIFFIILIPFSLKEELMNFIFKTPLFLDFAFILLNKMKAKEEEKEKKRKKNKESIKKKQEKQRIIKEKSLY